MRDANFGWNYPPGCSGPPDAPSVWEYSCHNPQCEEFGNVVEGGECADCDSCGEELHDADETVPERCETCRNLIDDCMCYCIECGEKFPVDDKGDPITPADRLCGEVCRECVRENGVLTVGKDGKTVRALADAAPREVAV
jgi:hypothetical protein